MAHTEACIFCLITAGRADASRIYEDDLVVAFMDIHPVTPGHLLVVPRQHAPDLESLDQAYAARMFTVGRRLALALYRSGIRCQGANLYLADGPAAGQTVFHSHLHVIPRFAGDGFKVSFPAGYGDQASKEQLADLAAQIRAALD